MEELVFRSESQWGKRDEVQWKFRSASQFYFFHSLKTGWRWSWSSCWFSCRSFTIPYLLTTPLFHSQQCLRRVKCPKSSRSQSPAETQCTHTTACTKSRAVWPAGIYCWLITCNYLPSLPGDVFQRLIHCKMCAAPVRTGGNSSLMSSAPSIGPKSSSSHLHTRSTAIPGSGWVQWHTAVGTLAKPVP